MAFCPDGELVINYTSGGSPATNQTFAWQVSCGTNNPESAVWMIAVDLTQSGGATAPTAELILEWSANGTDWIRFLSASTASGTPSMILSADGGSINVARYVRARLVVAGGTAPAVVAKCLLGCSVGFSLVAV